MSRLWTRFGLAALAIAVVAGPAFAHVTAPPGGGCRVIRGAATPDPADDVSVCRQDVFLHKAEAPLGNLAATGQVGLPSWDTTKPDGTLAEAGVYVSSGEADIVSEGNPAGRAQFEGTFTGTLDTLGFRMFMRDPFDETAGEMAVPATLYLEIDGEVIHNNYDASLAPVPVAIHGTEEALYYIDGAFTKLYQYMSDQGMDLSVDKEHSVKIGVAAWTFPGSETIFLYDADEAQSGLFFNLENTSMAGFTKVDVTAAA